jgi:pyruvate,water dikinase
MNNMDYLITLTTKTVKKGIGNKAAALVRLLAAGFDLPVTRVVPEKVFRQFNTAPELTLKTLAGELSRQLDPTKTYAVRSSSRLEDSDYQSYAGQFASFLNVSGLEEILTRIKQVWESAELNPNTPYDIPRSIKKPAGMAVIVQEMIDAQWSGVAFSRNPVTGRPEIVIETVKGSGDQLVQQGITPVRFTAIGEDWTGDPMEEGPGKTTLQQVRDQLLNLKGQLKKDIDVEWVFNGQKIYFIQWRPVTISRYPVIFANHISREVLPGMIKPLVWSVNVPLVNSAWIRVLEKIMGPLGIKPEDLSRQFYYRAYFNMGTFGTLFEKLGMPPDSLENLMGRKNGPGKSRFRPSWRLVLYLPGITVFLCHFFLLIRHFRKQLKRFETEYTRLADSLQIADDPSRFRENYEALYDFCSRVAYYNIVIPVYMNITNALLQRKLRKSIPEKTEPDFTRDFPELKDLDPQSALEPIRQQWFSLDAAARSRILEGNPPGNDPEYSTFSHILDRFFKRFGHFSESGNDFSYPPWRENQALVFDMINRQLTRKEGVPDDTDNPVMHSIRRSAAYRRAGKMRLYRELISSFYTKAYGLFRPLFLGMGRSLTETGILSDPEDVFFLDLCSLWSLLENDPAPNPELIRNTMQSIRQTKQEMRDLENVSLPAVVYGEHAPPLEEYQPEGVFRGIPASMGYARGTVTVIKSLQDIEKMTDGTLLIIPFADIGWTPLLVRAGAIVCESGGMLSHAAIIARELGIPAIVSVDHACTLQDGTPASVDGQNGILRIGENAKDDDHGQ